MHQKQYIVVFVGLLIYSGLLGFISVSFFSSWDNIFYGCTEETRSQTKRRSINTSTQIIRVNTTGVLKGQQLSQCWWQFHKYHPSEFEVLWKQDITINQESVCDRMTGTYREYVGIYLRSLSLLTPDQAPEIDPETLLCSTELMATYNQPDQRAELDHRVFSRFEYRFLCDGGKLSQEHTLGQTPGQRTRNVSIDPIAGVLRHPAACLSDQVLRKDYFALSSWAMYFSHTVRPNPALIREQQQSLNFYFDLGASLWKSGAGGASQEWINSVYETYCIKFDHIYAWEVTIHNPCTVMSEIPDSVKPKYHWFNIPANPSESSGDNPLHMILSETTPSDFVVLKIDIDNWKVEEKFVQQILDFPEISARIDEMYWEHHVNFHPMNTYWGASVHDSFKMVDSIKIFEKLRNLGIRAHSWV